MSIKSKSFLDQNGHSPHCYFTTRTIQRPGDYETLKYTIDFIAQITKPLTLIDKHVTSVPDCSQDLYVTSDYRTCNLLDVKQVLITPVKTCLPNRTLPLLSLKLEELCFLHARSKPAVTPYGNSSCQLLAKGVADYLEIPYLPIEHESLDLHVLWATTEGIKWIPFLQASLQDKNFLCVKDSHTSVLEHKESHLIKILNKYIHLIESLQNIFHVTYFDDIITSARSHCDGIDENSTKSATPFLLCLKQELIDYARDKKSGRRRRSLVDIFSERASNTDINNALETTYQDMQKLQAFSSSLLANEKKMSAYVNSLKRDFSHFSSQQRILTLYHEMVSKRFIPDMIHQVQLDILTMDEIYSELDTLVKNILTISELTQPLFEGGRLHHVNSHHFTCEDDIYSCTWELETRLLKPFSTNQIICQAMYNGSHAVIPAIHNMTYVKHSPNISMHIINDDGSLQMDAEPALREFSDAVFGTTGQMYMNERGIQHFICLTARQVTIDGVPTACQPNKKIPVYHRVVLGNITYLVKSHYLIEQNLQRAAMDDSFLQFIGHIGRKTTTRRKTRSLIFNMSKLKNILNMEL